jgi:hypothetical protein
MIGGVRRRVPLLRDAEKRAGGDAQRIKEKVEKHTYIEVGHRKWRAEEQWNENNIYRKSVQTTLSPGKSNTSKTAGQCWKEAWKWTSLILEKVFNFKF